MRMRKAHKGMTMVEMIVFIVVFSLVMGAILSSALFFYRTNRHIVEQAFAIESARKGVELMTRTVRETTFADDGSYPIISMSDEMFYIYSDIDRDDSVERLRYFLNGSDLRRGLTESSGAPPVYDDADEVVTTVSDSVRNTITGTPVFTYFDESGAEITDYADVPDVAFVRIELIVNVNPLRVPDSFTLRSSASLRNIKEDG